MADHPTPNLSRTPPNTGSTFRERLGIYLLGVSLGLLMLGLFWSLKRSAALSQQQQQQQSQQQTPAPTPAPAAP